MEASDSGSLDLLSLTQLRQVVSTAQAQPYRIHAQVESNSQKQTAQGKPYLEIKLSDGSEPLTWRVFDGNPIFLEAGGLSRQAWVELSADWIDTGKYGLEPKNPQLRRLSDDEVQSLLLGSDEARENLATDYGTLIIMANEMADPRLKALALAFLDRHGERMRRTAAARDFHHARRGGLVEHVAQMMRSAKALCAVYTQLNADLLVAGVLFHDCGKLWETVCPENSFHIPLQLHGEMLGHISIGMELVNKLWRDCMEQPEAKDWIHMEPPSETVRLHLLHLVASHHGTMEFGSPVLPKTPEAMALHYIDNLDAKLEMFRRGYETSDELAPGIYEGVRPLRHRMISPLPSHRPQASE
jgi:3'-5' exoribonuclease